jgi:hypothetical protein
MTIGFRQLMRVSTATLVAVFVISCGQRSTSHNEIPAPVIAPVGTQHPDDTASNPTPTRNGGSNQPQSWLPSDSGNGTTASRPQMPASLPVPNFKNVEETCELEWQLLQTLYPAGARFEYLLPNGIGFRIPIAGVSIVEVEEITAPDTYTISIKRTISPRRNTISINPTNIYPIISEVDVIKKSDTVSACQNGQSRLNPLTVALMLPPGTQITQITDEKLQVPAGTFNSTRSRVLISNNQLQMPFPKAAGVTEQHGGELEIWTVTAGLRVIELKSIIKSGNTSITRELISFSY